MAIDVIYFNSSHINFHGKINDVDYHHNYHTEYRVLVHKIVSTLLKKMLRYEKERINELKKIYMVYKN